MSEQISPFQRPEIPVVGSGSDQRKKEVEEELQKNFSHNREQLKPQALVRLKMLEYQKHDFEKAAIQEINRLLNKILEELGISSFDIPAENIYSVPKSLYKEIDESTHDTNGFTAHREQIIVLNSEELDQPYTRISVLLHEMIHLKGFVSVETTEKQRVLRRIGIQTQSSIKRDEENNDSFRQLIGLNEAVVSELQKRLFLQVITQNPYLDEEREKIVDPVNEERIAKATKKTGLPKDEFVYVEPQGDDGWEAMTFPYLEQRKVLNYLLNTIQKANPEQFPSQDDVFKLFLQAHFKGELLPLARAIDDTFGKGTFRIIGMMSGQDEESAYRTLAYLKKNTHLDLRA